MANILFVCTANICRSPAAEAIARARFSESGHSFASAGFLFEGRPAEPEMLKALREVQIDGSGHRSRILSVDIAEGADLILTMEARHVQDIALMSSEVFAKTLPLTEMGERLEGSSMAMDRVLGSLSERDPLRYLDSRWDVEDPYKRSKRRYRRSVAQISDLVGKVVPRLR